MPIKFVAEVVKGLFGISEQRNEEAETETSITVERETGRASEGEPPEADESSAVESAGESETSGESVESSGEPADASGESAEASGEPAETSGEPVDDIRGIGPTYSERLADIGIVTVGDLAAVDVSEVADAAEVSESRAADWLSQAEDR